MRSKESYTKKAFTALNKALLNGPLHCFGVHSNCSSDFCTGSKNLEQLLSSMLNVSSTDNSADDHDVHGILERNCFR